jgi:hypothetical protein
MNWNEDAILEDYELYLKLTAKGEFAVDDNVLAAWRQHAYNTSRDFPKMMNEWLAAQKRVAPEIGIGPEKLRRIQSELKFICVADFIRQGRKSEAARMLWENRGHAASNSGIGKALIRLLIPQFYHDWHRNRRRRQKIRQYGKIEI